MIYWHNRDLQINTDPHVERIVQLQPSHIVEDQFSLKFLSQIMHLYIFSVHVRRLPIAQILIITNVWHLEVNLLALVAHSGASFRTALNNNDQVLLVYKDK